MKTGAESAELRFDEAFDEIAEGLVLVLANSLRWLAMHPRSSGMLLIKGFVRDGELTLVVDMPRQSALDPRESLRPNGQGTGGLGSQAGAFGGSLDRGLRVFALPIPPPGE